MLVNGEENSPVIEQNVEQVYTNNDKALNYTNSKQASLEALKKLNSTRKNEQNVEQVYTDNDKALNYTNSKQASL